MANIANSVGISAKDTYNLMAKQAGGRQQLSFLPDDYKNYLREKCDHDMALGEAGAIMQYLQNCQRENHHFSMICS